MKVLLITLALSFAAFSQVKTEVPPVEPGRNPSPSRKSKYTAPRSKAISRATLLIVTSIVYLPPGYAANKKKRYPVVYALHGYSIGAEQWSQEIHTPQVIEGAFAQRRAGDDRCAARLQNCPQRLHVFEFGHNRRFRALHRA